MSPTTLTRKDNMRLQRSTARRSFLAVLVASLLVLALTACGVGPATNEEKISKTATTYLEALAEGDAATACSQLTPRAKGGGCEARMAEHLAALDSETLTSAANGSMDIDVDGDTATAGLSEPEGARFVLARIGDEWRIDSGYTLGPTSG
jgi:hypothetical protein